MLPAIRRVLDAIYDLAGVLAAISLVCILAIIVIQMTARWVAVPFHGSEYAGYFMAAASFLAFAHTLNRGGHIRVGLLLNALGRHRYWGELWCLVVASFATGYLAWYAVRTVYWSWRLGDVSQGQDATPLWIAQMPMAVGAVIFAVCILDNTISLAVTGRDNVHEDPAARTE